MKYVILESEEGMRFPIIFPEQLVHANVATLIAALIDRRIEVETSPISAGSFSSGVDFSCHGGSDTLKISQSPYDEAIIGLGESAALIPLGMLSLIWAKAKAHRT